MSFVLRPRDCNVSATLAGLMVPVESASRTEKDSLSEWRRAGGSRDTSSPMAAVVLAGTWEDCLKAGGCGSFLADEGDAGVSGSLMAAAGSVAVFVGVMIIDSSSSSSDTVYECFSFDGDDSGDAWTLEVLGGVLALKAVGELGEPARRKGDDRVDIEKDCDGR